MAWQRTGSGILVTQKLLLRAMPSPCSNLGRSLRLGRNCQRQPSKSSPHWSGRPPDKLPLPAPACGRRLHWVEGVHTGNSAVRSAPFFPMKFDEVYPDAQPGIPPARNVVLALHEHQERPCVVCGAVTRWFHRELIVHICSQECVETYVSQN